MHWESEMDKTNLKRKVQALQKAEIDSHAHLGCSSTSTNTAVGLGQVCLKTCSVEEM